MLEDWGTNHFPNLIPLSSYSGKTKPLERVETAANAVEEANDKEDKFVNANDNYYEDPQKEKEEGNWEDTTTSTCNTAAATSRRNETSKKKTKSSNGTGELVEQLFNFQKVYEEATQEIKGIAFFVKKEAEGTDMRLFFFVFRPEGSWGIF